jgi:hypothetical protein
VPKARLIADCQQLFLVFPTLFYLQKILELCIIFQEHIQKSAGNHNQCGFLGRKQRLVRPNVSRGLICGDRQFFPETKLDTGLHCGLCLVQWAGKNILSTYFFELKMPIKIELMNFWIKSYMIRLKQKSAFQLEMNKHRRKNIFGPNLNQFSNKIKPNCQSNLDHSSISELKFQVKMNQKTFLSWNFK